MIRIAICDDEPDQIQIIKSAVQRYLKQHQDYQIELRAFSNPLYFLDEIEKNGGCEIVLLDICMPGISGTEIAQVIRNRQDDAEIIFLTTSTDFAIDAFALKATHYVVKPFSQNQFDEALDRAMKKLVNQKSYKLILRTENGSIQAVNAEEILYIESVQYDRVVHTRHGQYKETRRSLTRLQEELEQLLPEQFIQPYRGYVVNLAAIRTITSKEIILQDGTPILIKSGDFRKLRDLFFQWSFEERRVESK